MYVSKKRRWLQTLHRSEGCAWGGCVDRCYTKTLARVQDRRGILCWSLRPYVHFEPIHPWCVPMIESLEMFREQKAFFTMLGLHHYLGELLTPDPAQKWRYLVRRWTSWKQKIRSWSASWKLWKMTVMGNECAYWRKAFYNTRIDDFAQSFLVLKIDHSCCST